MGREESSTPGEPTTLDARQLFVSHADFIAGFLRRMGVPPGDLDDVVQEVFLVAHRKNGYVEGPARPTTWLAGIAFREALAWRRRGKARPGPATAEDAASLAERSIDPRPDPEHAADSTARLERVARALDAMQPEKRAIFMLYELEGETCESIAAGLGVPIGTVYSRLHAARGEFKKALRRTETIERVAAATGSEVKRGA